MGNLKVKGVGRDKNGNKIVRLYCGSNRGFSIQTNGNLPFTHSNIFKGEKISKAEREKIVAESKKYIKKYGTDRQRRCL